MAAAGNDGINTDTDPVYPAAFDADNIISVAATDRYDERASFSNIGKVSVDLGAPGVGVYSLFPRNRYGNLTGTSMSTPHVSGAAALIWAYKPAMSLQELRSLLFSSVDRIDGLQGNTVTEGRRNVHIALALGLFMF